MVMFDLKGKTALITGSGQGIGRETALLLAAQGAKVIINWRSRDEIAQETLDELQKAGAEFKYIVIKAFGEGGRCHLHIIMSGGVNRDDLENAWEYGRTNADRLQFNHCGVVDLSAYLAGQRRVGARRWSGSKNLIKPVEKVNENRYSKRDLKEVAKSGNPHMFFANRYEGYWLSEFPEVVKNPINGSYYMTFVMYKPDSENLEKYARRKGKKRE